TSERFAGATVSRVSLLLYYYFTHLTIHILSHFFFFNDTATTEIYTLSLHDALPILTKKPWHTSQNQSPWVLPRPRGREAVLRRSRLPTTANWCGGRSGRTRRRLRSSSGGTSIAYLP